MLTKSLEETISDDESLEIFVRKMREFDALFSSFMMKGSDFNIKLEVRGNKNEILYVRVNSNDSEQPRGAQKRIDKKNPRKLENWYCNTLSELLLSHKRVLIRFRNII